MSLPTVLTKESRMGRVRPWMRTILLLGATFVVYASIALLITRVSGDSIVGSAVAAVVMAVAALGYRRWTTGAVLAGPISPGAAARSSKFWAYATFALLVCWLTGQTASMWIYRQWGDTAFDAHNTARADSPVWLLVITSLLLAPLGEEAMMRGIAYPAVRRHWPVLPSALVTAAAFAILHGNLIQIAVALPLGVLLALVYEATRRLWPVVLMHAVFNFASLFTPRTAIEQIAIWPVVLAALIVLLIVITALYRTSRPASTPPDPIVMLR